MWMVLFDGDGLKSRAKRVHLLIEATPAGYSKATRQILELHGFGLGLLTVDCAEICMDKNELKVDWLVERHLSDEHIMAWDESLYNVVSGLR